MKSIYTIVISFLFINVALAQQSFRVKGIITDQITGEKIIGVSIKEKGATNGTTTDVEGKFSFTVASPNAFLIVSYIGYSTKEVQINNQTDLIITFKQCTF